MTRRQRTTLGLALYVSVVLVALAIVTPFGEALARAVGP